MTVARSSSTPSLVSRFGAAALVLAPKRLQRAVYAFQGRSSVYSGADVNRLLSDWVATLQTSDDEIRWNIIRLRARGRELARNNPYARAFLHMLAANVVGPTGIKLQSQVRAGEKGDLVKWINDRIEDGWAEWSEAPTICGKHSLTSFQHLAIKTVAKEGELFIRQWVNFPENRFRYAIEAVDADLVDEMMNRAARGGELEIRMGVEVNQFGRPLAYYVWNKPASTLGSLGIERKRERIPSEQIIHIFDPERVNQTRGIPWQVAVMVALKMLEGYQESEAVAARVSAAKMGFWVRKEKGDIGTLPVNPVTNTMTMEANPGSFSFGPEGHEFQAFDPNHPNAAFAEFSKGMLRKIASGSGVSYNALANDLEGVNYSSMRSGLLIERETWRMLQTWWISRFLQPVYRRWIHTSILAGAIKLDTRDHRQFERTAKWSPRGWPWVDPLKDVQAAKEAIALGLGSRTQYLAEQGLDFEEILEQLAEEQRMADEAGIVIAGVQPAGGADKPGAEEDDDEDASGDEKDADAEAEKKESGDDEPSGNGNRSTENRIDGVPVAG